MSQQWDAICIGSGLGSLTAGALWAKSGKRVLVLERHDRPGGAATNFTRKGIKVEVGLHEMDGLDEKDSKRELFSHLGIFEEVEFVQVPELYAVRSQLFEGDFFMPYGEEAAKAALYRKFPERKKAIDAYFKEITNVQKAVITFIRAKKSFLWWLINGPLFPFRFRSLFKHDKTTVSEVLDRLFGKDEKLKIAVAANFAYYGHDPKTLGFMYFAIAQASFLSGGGHFIKGGSQKLPEALVRIIKAEGGEIRFGRLVTEIRLDKGRVSEVVHADAPRVGSRNSKAPSDFQSDATSLVFAGTAPELIRDMLPVEDRSNFYEPFAAHQPGTSLWSIYLGLDRKPEEFGMQAYSMFIIPPKVEKLDDLAENPMATMPGGKVGYYIFVDYARIDSGLGGEGKYYATLCGIDRLSNWDGLDEEEYKKKKSAWLEALLADLEKQFPGIESAIFYKEMATARTIHTYLNTPGGAVYGYDQTPSSGGRNRKGPLTPIPGLLLSSAFSSPGGGFTGAIFTGAMAAGKAAEKL